MYGRIIFLTLGLTNRTFVPCSSAIMIPPLMHGNTFYLLGYGDHIRIDPRIDSPKYDSTDYTDVPYLKIAHIIAKYAFFS